MAEKANTGSVKSVYRMVDEAIEMRGNTTGCWFGGQCIVD